MIVRLPSTPLAAQTAPACPVMVVILKGLSIKSLSILSYAKCKSASRPIMIIGGNGDDADIASDPDSMKEDLLIAMTDPSVGTDTV